MKRFKSLGAAIAMVCFRSSFGLLSLVHAGLSSGMPLSGFFHSMFVPGDLGDGEEYEEEYPIVKTEWGDVGDDDHGTTEIVRQQDFLLDDALYSAFNTIGQAQFNILQQKGLDSVCWRNAAVSINADCVTMAHSRKQRLAVQLSNCHLEDAGRKGTRCGAQDSDEFCVEGTKHDDVAFTSYTTFFHHVNAICHHLSHTTWQEQTEGLVRGLTASSLATFDRAEQTLEKQELVLRGQELASEQTQGIAEGLSETSVRLAGLSDSLSQELVSAMGEIQKQEELLARLMVTQTAASTQASKFSGELASAKSELSSYMRAAEEDRRAARDQNIDLMRTIDFIHDCLENASSAWERFQAFTYLIFAANICWVLTTVTPLQSARTSLFALVAFGLMIEKSLCVEDSSQGFARMDWLVAEMGFASPGAIAATTWAKIFTQEKIRWLTFQGCAVILGHTLVSYYLPFLEMGRVVGLLMRVVSRWSRHSRSQDEQSPRRGRESLGSNHAGGSFAAEAQAALLPGDRSNRRSDLPWSASRYPRNYELVDERCRRSVHNVDHDDVGPGGHERELDPRLTVVREQAPPGRGRAMDGRESVRGGHVGGTSGGYATDDGLDSLNRQELQSLAKETDGLVRANQSTSEIKKGLRNLGVTAK